nr:protease Do-like 5, chloroplastic isoform X1 [Nicotiana tomentosiformis]XP_018628670.1 protease Do-like 5, chloroplastic isoform X1 [Nicotiana tomentosiformis]XP_033513849.1 protease Do-like 5, chloroplastic isoform X1 [Nicotiana tomentosiformis]XP_033513850.1 protease Do-like 5, chloroplastic isoform X1 [Nicotiana tomentosiformis]
MQQLKGQVTDYHVIAKLATDQSGLQHCKVSLVNAKGESIAKGAKIVGVDPAYDLAFLKVVSGLGREIRHQMEPPLKDLFNQRLPLMEFRWFIWSCNWFK